MKCKGGTALELRFYLLYDTVQNIRTHTYRYKCILSAKLETGLFVFVPHAVINAMKY